MRPAFRSSPRSQSRASTRGFTLVELMVVVAMVGVLSAIGIVSFRRQAAASKSIEAASVIQAIRAAEEAYRAENQLYLDVSTSNDDWYPSGEFGPVARSWGLKAGDHVDLTKWETLGPRVMQPVQFGYLVNAGSAGQTPPALQLSASPVLAAPRDVWYLIQARADYDGDGKFCNAAAASWTPELFIENEGE